MGRHVEKETVVTLTCDGCGGQDVLMPKEDRDTRELPEGWGILFVIQNGRDHDFQPFNSNPVGKSSCAKHTLEVYSISSREFPGRKYLACSGCVKRLGTVFQKPLSTLVSTPKPGIWARIRGVFWPLTLLPYYLPGSKLALPKEEEEKPS